MPRSAESTLFALNTGISIKHHKKKTTPYIGKNKPVHGGEVAESSTRYREREREGGLRQQTTSQNWIFIKGRAK